jgi:hypothetical protein
MRGPCALCEVGSAGQFAKSALAWGPCVERLAAQDAACIDGEGSVGIRMGCLLWLLYSAWSLPGHAGVGLPVVPSPRAPYRGACRNGTQRVKLTSTVKK